MTLFKIEVHLAAGFHGGSFFIAENAVKTPLGRSGRFYGSGGVYMSILQGLQIFPIIMTATTTLYKIEVHLAEGFHRGVFFFAENSVKTPLGRTGRFYRNVGS